jgi:hypothetical protein
MLCLLLNLETPIHPSLDNIKVLSTVLSYAFILASCKRVNPEVLLWSDNDYKLAIILLNF